MGDNENTTVVKSTNSVPLLGRAKTYELWKKELGLWKLVTDIKPEKLAITVVLSLPEDCTFGKNIKSTVLENIKEDVLKKTEGYDKVLDYLDELLGKDKEVDKFDRFKEFVFCKKTEEESIDDFITRFDNKVSRLQSTGQEIDGSIITFMLILNSNLSRMETSLIFSKINFEDTSKTYESAKKQMRQTLGIHVASTTMELKLA